MRAVGEKDRTVERRREQNEAEGTQTDRIRHTAEVPCVCLCVSQGERERERAVFLWVCCSALVYHVVSASLYTYYFHVWARLKMATGDKPLHLCHVCMSSLLRADNGERTSRSVCPWSGAWRSVASIFPSLPPWSDAPLMCPSLPFAGGDRQTPQRHLCSDHPFPLTGGKHHTHTHTPACAHSVG